MPAGAWATPPAELAPRVFSTAGLPAARRVELWESHNASALIGLHIRAARALVATEVNVELPRLRLARVTGPAHAVERTREVIGRTPADAIAVFLTLRGDAWFAGADGTRELRPGDALVCRTDQPFARGFGRGLEELVVSVPCSALTASAARLRGPVVTSFGAQPGTAAGPAGRTGQYARALARIAGRAARTERPVPPDEQALLDLVAVLAAGREAPRAAAHRAAARSYIEEHLADPGLGAGQIAAAIGISERQLSRVFAADGTSVPRHILSRRLQLAHSALSAGTADGSPAARAGPRHRASPARTVAEVAAECGFTSAAYFSHAFRRHFGYRASELRPPR